MLGTLQTSNQASAKRNEQILSFWAHSMRTMLLIHPCDYRKKIVVKKKSITEGDYFHYLHHRYFECNYGNLSVPWDHLFGTFHDGSKKSKKMLAQRLKQRGNKIKDFSVLK